MRNLLIAALIAVAAPSAYANVPAMGASGASKAPIALTEGDFAAQRSQIESDLAGGEKYSEISPADREMVRQSLARIAERLDGVSSVQELSEQAKIGVFNEQEKINTVLTQAAADSRVMCERVQVLGSHRRTTKCETVAERRRRSDRDRDNLQQAQGRTPRLESN